MSSLYDDMRRLIDEREAAEQAAQRDATNDERFDRIESAIGGLAESVNKLVNSSPPPPPGDGDGDGDPPPGDPPSPPDPEPPQPPDPELPLQRVTRGGVPRVYNGDDEPETVEYIDPDDGETKTRPGRRKGHPTTMQVENVEPEPPQEP